MLILLTAVLATTLGAGDHARIARAEVPDRQGMVVVAPSRFHEALKHYISFRRSQRDTELVSLESILESTDGVDDPERLKRWLYEQWKAHKIRYVLLVGDADVLPVRYMVLDRVTPAAFDYAFYPSDLYYADIARRDDSFDDWNARKSGFHAGYFGEVRGEKNKDDPINYDAIDYRPELAVGRWPVSTEEQVRRVADKTIAYEQTITTPERHGLRRAVFVAVPGWVDTRGIMTGWAAALPLDWEILRLYGEGSRESAWDERRVVEVLNEGASLICHAGHGQDDRWDRSLGVEAIATLQNGDRLPVIISAGCSTARFATLPPYEAYEDVFGQTHIGTNAGETFDQPPPPPNPYAKAKFNPTGLGERLVRDSENGAVAYIGCNTGSQPCGLTLLDGFIKTLAASKQPTLGDCWVGAVANYYEAENLATIKPNEDWYPASIYFQGMKFMVFGDPALRLPISTK